MTGPVVSTQSVSQVRSPGDRLLADTIVEDSELGSAIPEIQENYPDLQVATIEALLAFAVTHRRLHVA